MEWILKIFNKENRQVIQLTLLVVVILLWIKGCNDLKDSKNELKKQSEIADQNYRALNDSLTHVKNKAGELEATKSAFISKLEELKKINKDLYDEAKKENGELRSLIKGALSIKSNDIVISNSLKSYPDNKTFGLLFEKYKNDSGMTWSIKGESRFKLENNTIFPGETEIFNNETKVKLVLGFTTEKNGDYKVFARSGSPYVKFDDLDGVLIIPKKPDPILSPDKKKTRFSLGFNVGYGITTFNRQVYLGPYIGLGVTYNLINF